MDWRAAVAGIAKVLAWPLVWLVLLLLVAAGDARGRETRSVGLDATPIEGCDAIQTVGGAYWGWGCGIGFELALLLPPMMWVRCRRRRLIH